MDIKRDLSIIAVLVLIIFSAAMFKVGTGLLDRPAPAPGQLPAGDGTPVKPEEGQVTLRLNESASFGGVTITPKAVVDDSRCAEGVQCIWAGTVKVRTEIVSGLGTANEVIELGKSITTEAEEVALVAVTPSRKPGSEISPADYRLTYQISKRAPGATGPGAPLGKCYVGGCSGQICSDQEGVASTCEYREAYACYKTAKCERQASGQCGWTETPALTMCLKNAE